MHMKPRLPLLLRAAILVATIQLLAPPVLQSAPTNAPTVLPPVTVYATNHPSSLTSPPFSEAAQKFRQVPGGFSLQGADRLNQGRASSQDDFFQNAPGLVMRSENQVEVSKVFIRGSGVYSDDEPSGVQYLIDGLTLNQGDGEIILEDLDVTTFKYAEIYRGANALQYGGLGLGGAVNFVPYTGYDASAASVRLEGGSFGFFRGQLSSGGVVGPWDYYASFSGRTRDGYRDHSRESTELLFTDVGYKISDRLENRFYLIADQTDRQVPGALSLQQMEQDPQQAQDGAIAQNWRKDWTYLRLADKVTYQAGGEEADAGGYWWHRNAYEPNQFIPGEYYQGIGSFYADDYGLLLNSTTTSELFGRDNIFMAGFNPTAEREVDAYFANNNGSQGQLTGADIEWSYNLLLYAQNQHYLTDKLSLITGVQAGYAQRNFYDDYNSTADGDQSANLVFRSLSPKLGLIYELNEHYQVYANFSRSWQPPSFDNMVDFDNGTNTSQELTPLNAQTAWTAEVGTRGQQGRFQWDLSLYHAWMHDELLDQYDPTTGQEVGGVNIAHSSHQGIEAGLEIGLLDSIFTQEDKTHFGDRLTLVQDYTLSDLRFDHDPVFGNNHIAGVPEHDYLVQLMYENPNGFYAGPNLHWIATAYPVDNSNTLYTPAYALLGFKTGMQLNKNFSIFFEAKNLLDERYAASVDPISDNAANGAATSQTAQVFHPGDLRAFYFGVSWKL